MPRWLLLSLFLLLVLAKKEHHKNDKPTPEPEHDPSVPYEDEHHPDDQPPPLDDEFAQFLNEDELQNYQQDLDSPMDQDRDQEEIEQQVFHDEQKEKRNKRAKKAKGTKKQKKPKKQQAKEDDQDDQDEDDKDDEDDDEVDHDDMEGYSDKEFDDFDEEGLKRAEQEQMAKEEKSKSKKHQKKTMDLLDDKDHKIMKLADEVKINQQVADESSEQINKVVLSQKEIKEGINKYYKDLQDTHQEINQFMDDNQVGEFTIKLDKEPFEVYQMIKQRPDTIRIMVVYEIPFDLTVGSNYRFPVLKITFNDGRAQARAVPVVFQLNRIQQILEYQADQLGEYKITFAKFDSSPVVLNANVMTYRNDKGKKALQKMKESQQEKIGPLLQQEQKEEEKIIQKQIGKEQEKDLILYELKKVSSKLNRLNHRKQNQMYSHQIGGERNKHQEAYYNKYLVVETLVIVLLGYLQVKFIARQIDSKTIL